MFQHRTLGPETDGEKEMLFSARGKCNRRAEKVKCKLIRLEKKELVRIEKGRINNRVIYFLLADY